MKRKKTIPAFPEGELTYINGNPFLKTVPGATLRDYFAAKAMQSLINNVGTDTETRYDTDFDKRKKEVEKHSDGGFYGDNYIAMKAYEMADAMMIMRDK